MLNIKLTVEVQQTLAALGFVHTHHPAEWKDIGGPENGPKLIGNNEFDEYSKDNTSLYVEDGVIVAVEKTQPNPGDFPF